jgi:uracil-DNA glycosylase
MAGAPGLKHLPTIIQRLNKAYPNARYELNFETPTQLLVATILAAQCTDERVNQVTATLFKKYPDARSFAEADTSQLEEDLKPTGFYRNKTRAVQGACRELVARFGGEVPPRMEDLTTLPGVARKTANVVLNNAFRIPSGVIVDTHVARVSRRMGLTEQKKPEKIELDLMKAVPKAEWIQFGPAVVLLGRYVCTFHEPKCPTCVMNDICPKIDVGRPASDEDEEDAEAAPPAPEDEAVPPAKKKAPVKKAAAPAKKPAAAARPAATPAPTPAPAGPSLASLIPEDWRKVLAAELEKPYFKALEKFVASERKEHTVFPPEADVFNALRHTPFDKVKVVLLGQDPYHDDGQAHGLCFSVKPGVKPPPSLVNIFKELQDDVGAKPPPHGTLTAWADRGVLLLNTVLTVRAHEAGSHKGKGWEQFTDAIISALNKRPDPVVFLLWGNFAHEKTALIDTKKHRALKAAHPSPLSAKKFFGSKPFSGANAALKELGKPPIDWQLPTDPNATSASTAAAPAPVAKAAPAPAPATAARTAALATMAGGPAPSTTFPAAKPAPPPAPKLDGLKGLTELPESWLAALGDELRKPYLEQLSTFLQAERRAAVVVPAEADVFAAFRLTPFDRVKAVIVGDEPPQNAREADGLAFSVKESARPTAASKNISQELRNDLGLLPATTGSLEEWARNGVLLLNSVLTARGGKPGAHANKGWETFTDAVLKALNARADAVAFLLWCDAAHKKARLLDAKKHIVQPGPHPADAAFVGSRPFSRGNEALEMRNQSAVYWQLYAL